MKKAISLMLIAALFTTMTVSATPAAYAADSPSDADSGEYVKDEVLVVFEDAPSKQELRSITDEVDAKKVEEVETPTEETPYVVTLDKGESVEDAVQDLEKEKAVAYAQPNYLYSLDDVASGTGAAAKAAATGKDDKDLWNLKKVDTQQAWDLIDKIKKDGQPREKVTVAVLDSGVDIDHPDLTTLLNADKCVDVTNSGNRFGYAPLLSDEDGHGTRVSGIIAAESGNGGVAGVAAGNHNDLIELVVIDVYKTSKKAAKATSADIVTGINYACEEAGAKVINMSLGHDGRADINDSLLQKTILEKTAQGTTFVASGGNDASTKSWYPSDMDGVIGVISTTNYSNAFSQCKAEKSNYGPAKDLSAPGHLIKTTTKGHAYTDEARTGTSYAAPVVASVAAMMYYVNKNLNPNDIETIMETTATDLYERGPDLYTGAGNVNAYAAVAMAAGIAIDRSPGSLSQPSISANSAGYNSIKISWKPVSWANGYKVYRSTSKNGIYSQVKTISSGSTLSFTNTGLSAGKTYYYKAEAFGTLANKQAFSPLSNIVSAKPIPAAPGKLKLYHTTYTGIKLKWDKIAGASGYGIYRATSQNGKYTYIKRIKKGSTTTYTNSRLKPGKNYYYKVRAYRTVSGKRIYGAYSSAKVLKTTPAKTYISLKKDKRSRKAKLSWKKVKSVNGYAVYYSTSKNKSFKKAATKRSGSRSFTSKRLKKGKTYYYKVRAYKTYRGKRIYGPYSSIKSCRF